MANPQPSLEELITPMTRHEFETSIYRVMNAFGLVTSSWKQESVVRALIVAVSVVLAALSMIVTKIARLGFLELSSGVWLRIAAKFGFDTDFLPATYATGLVLITNTGGGEYSEPAGEMGFLGANGQRYVNISDVTVRGLQAVYVNVVATTIGKAGEAPAGTITNFSGTYPGLIVTNPTALMASDDEDDESLRSRARSAPAAVSPNGPIDAYEHAARTAKRPDGTRLGIDRVRVVRGPGDGSCTVYAANASGAVPGNSNDSSTDLGILQAALDAAACPRGMSVVASSATPLVLNIVFEAWCYAAPGFTTEATQLAAALAVSRYLASTPMGGDRLPGIGSFVFLDQIRQAIRAALPTGFHVVVSSPISDLACGANAVAVAGTVTGAIHWVSRNDGEAMAA